MAAVAELVLGGATQVYIRAAQAGWRILREEEKRVLPRTLLRNIVRMKMNNKGVNLMDYTIRTVRIEEVSDCLPLPLLVVRLLLLLAATDVLCSIRKGKGHTLNLRRDILYKGGGTVIKTCHYFQFG